MTGSFQTQRNATQSFFFSTSSTSSVSVGGGARWRAHKLFVHDLHGMVMGYS